MDETITYPREIRSLHPLEFHYFRVPRERWELMLTRVRQMGADAVKTIVPWSWHELRDNVFDLKGITHPTRDLADFLETCQAMGFAVLIDASPYHGAGLLAGGVPSWLLGEHLDILSTTSDMQPRRDPTSGSFIPSAEHPTYLKYLERWYRELSSSLASWAWSDGPVVALRADHANPNELEPSSEGIPPGWDYNPHVVEVQWPVWLRQQYDGIEALNAAWGTDYHSVSDAEFPRQLGAPVASPGIPTGEPRVDDATRFVAYAAAHAAETYARLLREAGWAGPILTEDDAPPAAPEHVAQVDPEAPHIGAGIRWAMGAPVRADGSPRRAFWIVKAAQLDMEGGVKAVEGGTLVTATESQRVRAPRPEGDHGVYRLLLDGRLLGAASRKQGDTLLMDYVAADQTGETDMFLVLDDPSAPLAGTLREYLSWRLMGKAGVLRHAGSMCQALAEALSSGATPPPGEGEQATSLPGDEGLQAAEQSLAEAQRAARRAAVSVGRLERLAGEVRGDLPTTASILPDLSAFSVQEQERLAHLRETSAQVAPALLEAAQSLSAACQRGQPGGEGLTIQAYRAALEGAETTAKEAEVLLASALARLRADLAAGALPGVAWAIQDWLTRTLQGLTAEGPNARDS